MPSLETIEIVNPKDPAEMSVINRIDFVPGQHWHWKDREILWQAIAEEKQEREAREEQEREAKRQEEEAIKAKAGRKS